MRVVITGATGKLGAGLVAHLRGARPDWTLVPIDRRADAAAGVEPVDVLDPAALGDAVEGADAVVHLAAIPNPLGHDPDEIMRVNVQGTHVVHRVAAEAGVGRVVLASSTAVVGTDWGPRDVAPDYLPIDEYHARRPSDPYGVSKVCAEEVAAAAARAGRVSSVVLRPPWIVDERDFEQLREHGGRKAQGLHTYAWVHLDDLAVAFERAVSVEAVHEVLFVAAPDSTLSVPLAEVYREHGGGRVRGLDALAADASGVSSARAESVLGWRAGRAWRSAADPHDGARETDSPGGA